MSPATCTVPKPAVAVDSRFLQFPSQMVNFAVATSALFDVRELDTIFRQEGERSYMLRVRDLARSKTVLGPGAALPLVKKMWASLNSKRKIRFNLTLLSHSNPQFARVVHYSLCGHGLGGKDGELRAGIGEAYTKGKPITPQIMRNFGTDLFLSPNRQDVEAALAAGIAAGQVFFPTTGKISSFSTPYPVLGFDFDRVLGLGYGNPEDSFKGDSEAYFKQNGLLSYHGRENGYADYPAHPGAFGALYLKLAMIRKDLRDEVEEILKKGLGFSRKKREDIEQRRLEQILLTARTGDAAPRVSTTMDYWDEDMLAESDGAFFCGKTPKAAHATALQADVLFDDGESHINSLRESIDLVGEAELNKTLAVLVPYKEPKKPEKPDNRQGKLLAILN